MTEGVSPTTGSATHFAPLRSFAGQGRQLPASPKKVCKGLNVLVMMLALAGSIRIEVDWMETCTLCSDHVEMDAIADIRHFVCG